MHLFPFQILIDPWQKKLKKSFRDNDALSSSFYIIVIENVKNHFDTRRNEFLVEPRGHTKYNGRISFFFNIIPLPYLTIFKLVVRG